MGRVCDVDSVVIRGEYHGFRYQGHYRCPSFSALSIVRQFDKVKEIVGVTEAVYGHQPIRL